MPVLAQAEREREHNVLDKRQSGLSPASSRLRAPECAASWTPVTSTGMTTKYKEPLCS
jgi:hypothetical protein